MIKLKDVSFQYENASGSAPALQHLSAEIQPGEMILLCGLSGCGKSTLIRIINGLIPSYYKGSIEGEVTVGDTPSENLSMTDRALLMGNVFQNPKTQFFNTDVTSEIAFTAENLGFEPKRIRSLTDKALEEFDLSDIKDASMYALSGGQKQRVACACAASAEPEILILDEPSSNLDYASIKKLEEILRRWKAAKKTIFISEHRLFYLKELADRVFYLKDGVLLHEWTGKFFRGIDDTFLHSLGLRSLNLRALKFLKQPASLPLMELRLENCRVSYRKKCVLNISDFHLRWRGLCALIGENGAGKTTFARAFCGLLKAKASAFYINGRKYSQSLRRRHSYMVMQDVNHQLFSDSVLDELMLNKNISEAEAQRLLDSLGLAGQKDAHPMSLSGGEKQRLSIAAALACQKDIFFFDEPTSGLDWKHMHEVSVLMAMLAAKGKMVFVITHDPEFITQSCSHVLCLKDGAFKDSFELTEQNRGRLFSYFN